MSIISVKQALIYGTNELKKSRLSSPHIDTCILLELVSYIPYERIISEPQTPISESQFIAFKNLIQKREKHVPVAYLTGSKEFYGMDFYVNDNVLVPRPETELLVEEVIRFVGQNTKKLKVTSYKLLEVGTGSGCISVALAKYLPNTKITATDISAKALRVARKNRKKHGVRNVRFKKSDLLEKISSQPDILVANLPYLTQEELREPSITKEPKLALYGGKEGLETYKKLFQQIRQRFISEDSRKISENSRLTIFIEIGENQARKAKDMILSLFPEAKIEIKKDLSKKDRLVIARF